MDVWAGYSTDFLVDYSNIYNYLLKENYTYILMAGQLDHLAGTINQYMWMKPLMNVSFWD